MKTWQNKLTISDLEQDFDSGQISIQELAGAVAHRLLEEVKIKSDSLNVLIEDLQDLANDEIETKESLKEWYDVTLWDLYNFADNNSILID